MTETSGLDNPLVSTLSAAICYVSLKGEMSLLFIDND